MPVSRNTCRMTNGGTGHTVRDNTTGRRFLAPSHCS